jgi:transcriptional regulator NrdR family protein
MGDEKIPSLIVCECGGKTFVRNTRGRATLDVIWRQRQCERCGKLFTTYESRVRPESESRTERAITSLLSAA